MYGVRDHLSFDRLLPLPFAFRGERVLPTLYGLPGLDRIVGAVLRTASAGVTTLTIEIHTTFPPARRELGEYGHLFGHWTDLTNAERMNEWADVLLRNHRWLRELIHNRQADSRESEVPAQLA